MAGKTRAADGGNGSTRNRLSLLVFFSAVAGIVAAAGCVIGFQPDGAKDVFNVVLPVFASWAGTVLAFYFGRENFESANRTVGELLQRVSEKDAARSPISEIMRPAGEVTAFLLGPGQEDTDVALDDLLPEYGADVTRLPVLSADGAAKYMIHRSRVDGYLAGGAVAERTLAALVDWWKGKGVEFGLDAGFVVVSETTSIAEAKAKLERAPSCQDIFVTKSGGPNEPLRGWVSNVRLAKSIQP